MWICTDTGIRLMARYAEDKSGFYRLPIRDRSVRLEHTVNGGIMPMRNGKEQTICNNLYMYETLILPGFDVN